MTLKAPARPGLSLSPVSVRGRPLHRTERQCAALIQLVMTRLRTRVARCAQPPTGRALMGRGAYAMRAFGFPSINQTCAVAEPLASGSVCNSVTSSGASSFSFLAVRQRGRGWRVGARNYWSVEQGSAQSSAFLTGAFKEGMTRWLASRVK
jgi:hypothetical protein